MSSAVVVSEKHIRFCFEALMAHLKEKPYPKPDFPDDAYPLFVTWHIQSHGEQRLRGCIGNFNAQKLHNGLLKYALISALKDSRFPPIRLAEIPRLSCAVSLLVNFEKAEDYLDWEIGVHGVKRSKPRPATNNNDGIVPLLPPPPSASQVKQQQQQQQQRPFF
ncbi:hypothetical protein RMCBS344292_18745 [Rhizopus microsporus]|nr:hypothetical protein RMCBS344292_18745 [Rhizopus microsporus]